MFELSVTAIDQNLDAVINFIQEKLAAVDCPKRAQFQIRLAVEEIYVNIAHYAYKPEDGPATIRCTIENDPLRVIIQFIDHGKPFNPLQKETPDIQKPAAEREIGGLGIFLAKKNMDAIDYEYKDGSNILTVKKQLDQAKS